MILQNKLGIFSLKKGKGELKIPFKLKYCCMDIKMGFSFFKLLNMFLKGNMYKFPGGKIKSVSSEVKINY